MQYILLIIVLAAFAVVGYVLGSSFGDFARDDKFSGKKQYHLDEDPDIQSSMHDPEA